MAENTVTDPVDPGYIKSFPLDYAAEIAAITGATKITVSTWDLPDDLVLVSEKFDDTSTEVRIDFAGARISLNYPVYNSIELDNGDARRRALLIPVRDAATFVDTSELKATLDAIRAAIAQTATRAQLRRQIGDKAIEWMTPEQLIAAETRFQQLYNDALRTSRVRSGEPFMATIHTRFVG
jgi:hypothetical protein